MNLRQPISSKSVGKCIHRRSMVTVQAKSCDAEERPGAFSVRYGDHNRLHRESPLSNQPHSFKQLTMKQPLLRSEACPGLELSNLQYEFAFLLTGFVFFTLINTLAFVHIRLPSFSIWPILCLICHVVNFTLLPCFLSFL
jgi:hypothetical protein